MAENDCTGAEFFLGRDNACLAVVILQLAVSVESYCSGRHIVMVPLGWIQRTKTLPH
jgi:hypothetical protein